MPKQKQKLKKEPKGRNQEKRRYPKKASKMKKRTPCAKAKERSSMKRWAYEYPGQSPDNIYQYT